MKAPGSAGKKFSVRYVAERFAAKRELEPVGLYVGMRHGRRHVDLHAVERPPEPWGQHLDVVADVAPHVLQHHRIVAVQGVLGDDEHAPRPEAAAGHGLDHDVDVVAVIDMLMRQDDRVQLAGLEAELHGPHETAGPRVEQDVLAVKHQPHAAALPQLAGYDHPAPGRPEERDL